MIKLIQHIKYFYKTHKIIKKDKKNVVEKWDNLDKVNHVKKNNNNKKIYPFIQNLYKIFLHFFINKIISFL